MQKYLKEVSLLDQGVPEGRPMASKPLDRCSGLQTPPKGFTLYVVGEGIERKWDDFGCQGFAAGCSRCQTVGIIRATV